MKKSHFLRKKLIFLGHVISEKEVTMDPEKVQTIQNFQPPQNKKQVQAFLGIKLQEYHLIIRHISGKENVGADTLTRYPQSPDEEVDKDKIHVTINKLTLMEYSEEVMKQFDQLQVTASGQKITKNMATDCL